MIAGPSCRSLGADDSVKLVRYAIVSLRRCEEKILPAGSGEILVTESMTGESFAVWMVARYLQSDAYRAAVARDRRDEIRHEDKKSLRVAYEVLDCWPREPRDCCHEDRLGVLESIRDAVRGLSQKPVRPAAAPSPEVSATLPAGPSAAEGAAERTELSEQERRVLQALADLGNTAATSQLVDQTGLGKTQVREAIKGLEAAGRIRRVGEGFHRRYRSVEQEPAPPPAAPPAPPVPSTALEPALAPPPEPVPEPPPEPVPEPPPEPEPPAATGESAATALEPAAPAAPAPPEAAAPPPSEPVPAPSPAPPVLVIPEPGKPEPTAVAPAAPPAPPPSVITWDGTGTPSQVGARGSVTITKRWNGTSYDVTLEGKLTIRSRTYGYVRHGLPLGYLPISSDPLAYTCEVQQHATKGDTSEVDNYGGKGVHVRNDDFPGYEGRATLWFPEKFYNGEFTLRCTWQTHEATDPSVWQSSPGIQVIQ